MIFSFRNWLRNQDELEVKKIHQKIIPQIDKQYEFIKKCSDEEMANFTFKLRMYLQNYSNKGNGKWKYMAFAAVKEAVRRILNITMHDVQLIAGWLSAEGKVVEMMTGEGKTIVSLLPAYWFSLFGQGVHIITTNEYLAKRDYEEMGKVLRLLGVQTGLIHSGQSLKDKQEAYQQDITYGIWSEFGFDYLRDHLVLDQTQRVQRGLSVAIIDELDSILIDEARTPLVIAYKTKSAPDLYYVCSRFVRGLREGRDYEIDRETKQVVFTELAINKIEATFQIDNLYDLENSTLYHYLIQSLRAKVLMKKNVDYIVSDNQVKIIDSFTGRILEGRQYSEGLQQAIEAKENVPLSEENQTQATITVQKYFQLYKLLTGMSGTIKPASEELRRIYGLDIVSVPTHHPVIRQDLEDRIFLTKEDKYDFLVNEIEKRHLKGQPVLVGTTSIEQSEEISERLTRRNLNHQLLNAKSQSEEADIIARAGQKGAITIATNMAGRGTDIKLGNGVAEIGGLHVIGTERHESRRIDLQLRGRAGRQGDPGSSQFFLSLEDDLVQRYASQDIHELRNDWKFTNQGVCGGKYQEFFEKTQRYVENQLLELRSQIYRLDSIIHDQRTAYYRMRNLVLNGGDNYRALYEQVSLYIKLLIPNHLTGH